MAGDCVYLPPDPQEQLLEALKTKDIVKFKEYISSAAVDPNHCYDYPVCKSCLEIICSNPGYSQFAATLLEQGSGVEVNAINDLHGKAPIHFATEKGQLDTLRVLLAHKDININIQTGDEETSLHLAINAMNGDNNKDYERIIETLLEHKSDVNIPDTNNLIPIALAIEKKLKNVVRIIMKNAFMPDYDSILIPKKDRDLTARMMVEKFYPDLIGEMPPRREQREINIHTLFADLNQLNEDQFIANFNTFKETNDISKALVENNGMTFLQRCCERGLDRAVSLLLENGADPNLKEPPTTKRPIVLACEGGYPEVLKLLMAQESISFEPEKDRNGAERESLIHRLVKKFKQIGDPTTDHKECLDILLQNQKLKSLYINYQDFKGNTALHYAAMSRDQDMVHMLLKNGANLVLKNDFEEPALDYISPKILEKYLDDCLTDNKRRPNEDHYELRFDYNFLVNLKPSTYSVHSTYKKGEVDKGPEVKVLVNPELDSGDLLAPETSALLHMTQFSELKPLLKHPVVTSFLYLKWQRISCLFYANIVLYALFCLSLILYILIGYRAQIGKSDDILNAVGIISRIIATIGLFFLVAREFLQMAVSPRKYFESINNYLEILLIVMTVLIVFDDSTSENAKQQYSAIAILLSSAEFVMLIGQFPQLSTNIVMFRKVSWTFFKFILWYCILIIAFSLCFYTLFRTPENLANVEDASEDEPNEFIHPATALFKTIVMMTGEFDAGSINFAVFPITSHVIFVIFVFMIPIVLFNLLNGLAVSDTQAIKENAELVGCISRVKLIAYFENLVFGNVAKNAMFRIHLDGCLKSLARRICLFPNYLPVAKIGVKINQHNEVVIGKIVDGFLEFEDDENTNCMKCRKTVMNRKIVKAAKLLVAERDDQSEMKEVLKKLEDCQTKLEHFETLLNRILNKS